MSRMRVFKLVLLILSVGFSLTLGITGFLTLPDNLIIRVSASGIPQMMAPRNPILIVASLLTAGSSVGLYFEKRGTGWFIGIAAGFLLYVIIFTFNR